ncbi:MAG: Mrp/NBP35 family ATP-binding protein, partial [Saprospiraceae bacterium]|nr:Mrp/NBP35 family ATP-binding protein [Saprospiraceae bacterium]
MKREYIEQILGSIADPLINANLVQARRIAHIGVEGDSVDLRLTFPSSLTAEQKSTLIFTCVGQIQGQYPDAEVHVHVETSQLQSQPKSGPLPQVANIIAVGSGKGGVGKSTVATNLALALLAQGHRVGLLDADLYGPSIPQMLGLQGQRPKVKDVHGRAKILPLEKYGLVTMSMGFVVEPEQAVVLRGPRLAGIIKQFMEDCLWPELDYLVVDLPPGTGDIQLTLVQTVAVTGAIIVTTPQEVAVIDALKAVNMFRLHSIDVPLLGIVENMSWFTPADHPDERYLLFGEGGGEKLAQEVDSRV